MVSKTGNIALQLVLQLSHVNAKQVVRFLFVARFTVP